MIQLYYSQTQHVAANSKKVNPMNLTKQDLALLIASAGVADQMSAVQLNPEFLQIVGLYATAPNSEKIEMLSQFQSLAAQFASATNATLAKVSAEIELLKSQV